MYGKYYYELSDDEKRSNSVKMEDLGVSINHPVQREWEDEIVDDYLKNGIYNAKCIAWKYGVSNYIDGPLKTRYKTYLEEELKGIIEQVNNLDYKDLDNYFAAVSKACPKCFGTIQIINSLFFRSKGKIPIYDYYAHVGLKALLYNVSPQEVFVGEAPSKTLQSKGRDNKHLMAVNLLREYMRQLEQLKSMCSDADKYFDKNGMFIDRDLDRALWVYGHCSVKWPDVIYNKADNLMVEFDEAFKELAK